MLSKAESMILVTFCIAFGYHRFSAFGIRDRPFDFLRGLGFVLGPSFFIYLFIYLFFANRKLGYIFFSQCERQDMTLYDTNRYQ